MADVRVQPDVQLRGTPDGTTYDLVRTVVGDAQAATGILATSLMGFNGSTYDRIRGTTNGLFVQGSVASGSTDAGNPQKIGGKAVTALPGGVTTGQRVDGLFDIFGRMMIAVGQSASLGDSIADGNAVGLPSFGTTGLSQTTLLTTSNRIYNGSTHDRVRSAFAVANELASPAQGVTAALLTDLRNIAVTLATAVSSGQVFDVMHCAEMIWLCQTTTSGQVVFDVSADGTNYIPADTYDTQLDIWVTNIPLSLVNLKTYRVSTTGWRFVRIRVVTTLGATANWLTTQSPRTTNITTITQAAPPHSYGYQTITKTQQYTTTQTGAALWTPAAGKKICVTDVQIQCGGTTAGTLQLWFGGTADTTYTRGTDAAIFDGEFAPSATLKPGVIMRGAWQSLTADFVLRVTDSAAINPLTITVWGYEFV